MTDLTITTIIPTYNRANMVRRAVESALAASAPGDEIIVVDDGSTDHTAETLEFYRNQIRYYRVTNAGPSAARNFAISQSTSDLIAFLDDDDEWMPHKLALHRELMQSRPDILFSFSNFSSSFHDGRIQEHCLFNWGQPLQDWQEIIGAGIPYSSITSLPQGHEDFTVHIGDIYRSQMFDDYVLPSTLVVRRVAAGEALRFPEDLRYCESWACSSRLAKAGIAAYLDCDTAWQHGHKGPRLTDVDIFAQTAARILVLQRQWGMDREFLAHNRQAFQRRLDKEHLRRVRASIAQGDGRQARTELHEIKSGAPLHYRLLAHLPGFVLKAGLSVRQAIKHRKATSI